MLYPIRLISILFSCIFLFSCKSEFKKTLNGFSYLIITNNNKNKPIPGQIIYYQQAIHSDKLLENTPNYTESHNIFRFVDDSMLIQLGNPIYDLLKYLGPGDEGKVIFTKNPENKYPIEYGENEIVVFYIKVIQILSEEEHQQNEIKNREKLMQFREDYYKNGLKIDSLVTKRKQELINSNALNNLGGIKILTLGNNLINNQSIKPPNPNTILKISYSAYDLQGKKITSSFENREPYITPINSNKIPPGWQLILNQMNQNDELFCLIPSKILYGPSGFTGNVNIPPDADLIFYFRVEEVLR